MVEHQAGSPRRMQPLRGHSRETQDVGAAVRLQVHPWQTTDGLTSRVADRARSSAANLATLAHTQMTWSTRVPAP